MEEKKYMISDAAKQVQVECHVLRYWEEELGLPIKRNKLGQRCYTAEDVNRLKQIKRMKEQGFQLKGIRRALQEETLQDAAGISDGRRMQEGTEEGLEGVGKREAEVIQDSGIMGGLAITIKNPCGEQSEDAEKAALVKGCCIEKTPAEQNAGEEKSYRLQLLLKNMMVEAIREGNEAFCTEIKEGLLKELDYQFRMQEEREELREGERMRREEEHYRQLDELLRKKASKREGKEKRKKHSFF